MATERLGLGATFSTTYHEPFYVARLFQTLDLMTKGRAAWNVVTSVNDNEARNMGRDKVIAHDDRYDRADDFMEAALGLWDSWGDDAIILDKANSVFAKPGSVRRLDHEGEFYKTRGRLLSHDPCKDARWLFRRGLVGAGKSLRRVGGNCCSRPSRHLI